VGKALLAWLPKPEMQAMARQHGMKKRTPKTIITMSRLLADLELVREQG
jgi:DNA-binding IclR family transcriptional regulator